MIHCEGKYYDGLNAKPHEAALSQSPGDSGFVLTLHATSEHIQLDRTCVEIEPALGKDSPRTVRLPNGAKFYTVHSAALDSITSAGTHSWKNPQVWASKLEGHKYAILLSILLLFAILFLGYRYAIPAAADSLASKMPHSALRTISDNTLDVLDRLVNLNPTELSAERQLELQALFNELVLELGSPGYAYNLEFRSFPPNAFALPSGTIIFSDELIDALPDDEAIAAVLAHEIAHVEGRHGIRQLFRQAGVAFVLSTLLSDLSSAPALLSALPELLISSGYSRTFESEADLFSAHYLCEHEGSAKPMADALRTLRDLFGDMENESTELIATHPLLEKRILAVEAIGCD